MITSLSLSLYEGSIFLEQSQMGISKSYINHIAYLQLPSSGKIIKGDVNVFISDATTKIARTAYSRRLHIGTET
jgi:hypothetical protein